VLISSNYLETAPSYGLFANPPSGRGVLFGRDRIGHTTPDASWNETIAGSLGPSGPSGPAVSQGVSGAVGARIAKKHLAPTNIARVATSSNKSMSYNAATIH
jgi:hypothetical protein